MSHKVLCSLLVLIPSLACAEQYRFSPFTPSKQDLPLRKLSTLPRECYASISGSLFPSYLLPSRQIHNRYKRKDKVFLNELIRNQKGLVSLNGGYCIDQQNSLELRVASSFSPVNIIPSLVYKRDHLYTTDKLVISGKVGLLAIVAQEVVHSNVPDNPVRPEDSTSSRKGRSQSRSRVRKSKSTTRSKSKAAKSSQQIEKTLSYYQRHKGLALTGSFNAYYPLHPKVDMEAAVNLSRPFTRSFIARSSLPFGMIGSIQLGLHFKLA